MSLYDDILEDSGGGLYDDILGDAKPSAPPVKEVPTRSSDLLPTKRQKWTRTQPVTEDPKQTAFGAWTTVDENRPISPIEATTARFNRVLPPDQTPAQRGEWLLPGAVKGPLPWQARPGKTIYKAENDALNAMLGVPRALAGAGAMQVEAAAGGMKLAEDAFGLDLDDKALSDRARHSLGELAKASDIPEIEQGVASFVANTPGLALGGYKGLMVGIGALAGLPAYREASVAGKSGVESTIYGLGQALVETSTEAVPMGILFSKTAIPAMRRVLFATGPEVVGEQAATFFGDALEFAALHPEKTYAQFLDERYPAAKATLLATVGMLGGAGVGLKAYQTLVPRTNQFASVLSKMVEGTSFKPVGIDVVQDLYDRGRVSFGGERLPQQDTTVMPLPQMPPQDEADEILAEIAATPHQERVLEQEQDIAEAQRGMRTGTAEEIAGIAPEHLARSFEGMKNPPSLEEVMPIAEKYMRQAREGEAGRDWYEDSAREIAELFGGDTVQAERFIQMIAITSAGTEVKANLTSAMKAWDQYSRGEEIRVATGQQNDKLNAVAYHGKEWEGLKTNTFYTNLIEALRGHNSGYATMDLHMARSAFGLETLTPRQYEILEKITRAVAAELGIIPRQAQAQVWVAQKMESLLADWQERGMHPNLSEGERREHAFKRAMVSYGSHLRDKGWVPTITPRQTVPSEVTRAASRTITAEAIPSAAAGMPGILGAQGKDKAAFTKATQAGDVAKVQEVAALLGIPAHLIHIEYGTGGYGGGINPNMIVSVAPANGVQMTPAEQSKADALALAMMYVYEQDSVPWFRADPDLSPGDTVNGHQVSLGMSVRFDSLTEAQERNAYAALRAALGEDIGYSKVDDNTIVVLNFDYMAIPADTFVAGVQQFAEASNGRVEGKFGAESDYPAPHDWAADPSGAALLRRVAEAAPRSPGLQKGLRALREKAQSFYRRENVDLPQRADARDQAAFMKKAAIKNKFKDADEMFAKAPGMFEALAKQWRDKNPLPDTGQSVAPAWTSPLADAFAQAKQESMPAGQWLAWLKANQSKLGVKADEIAYSGIEEYLALRGKDKVSKAEIADYLAGNGVEVNVVEKGAEKPRVSEAMRREMEGKATDLAVVTPEDWIEYSQRFMRIAQRWQANGDQRKAQNYFVLAEEATRHSEGLDDAGGAQGTPKFASYWESSYKGGIPGTYRETLVTLPDTRVARYGEVKRRLLLADTNPDQVSDDEFRQLLAEEETLKNARAQGFRSSHWDEPNVLVHLRTDEVMGADGKRYLRVGEIQSDWGQKGKKEGFLGSLPDGYEYRVQNGKTGIYRADERYPEEAGWAVPPTHETNADALHALQTRPGIPPVGGVPTTPAAPFVTDTKAWVALGIKQAIRQAVDSGVDGIVFGTGQQNADLYDLSKQADQLLLDPKPGGRSRLILRKDGYTVGAFDDVDTNKLDDYVGKDLAPKLLAAPLNEHGMRSLAGVDLKVGGEGMKAFYDKIVPSVANEVLRKLGGGKVGTVKVRKQAQPGFLIPDAMRATLSSGMPMFQGEGDQAITARQALAAAATAVTLAAPAADLTTPYTISPGGEQYQGTMSTAVPQQFVWNGWVMPADRMDMQTIGEALQDLLNAGFPQALVDNVGSWSSYPANLPNMAKVYPKERAIAVRKDVLFKNEPALRSYLAHEMSHLIDMTENTPRGSITNQSLRLKPGGDLYVEAFNLHQGTGNSQGEVTLRKLLNYPLNQFAPQALETATELFAQLSALYFNNPGLMQQFLPKAYAAIGEIYAEPGHRVDDYRERLRQTLGVAPAVGGPGNFMGIGRGSNQAVGRDADGAQDRQTAPAGRADRRPGDGIDQGQAVSDAEEMAKKFGFAIKGQAEARVQSSAAKAYMDNEEMFQRLKRGVVAVKDSKAAGEALAAEVGWSPDSVDEFIKGAAQQGTPPVEILAAAMAMSRMQSVKLLQAQTPTEFIKYTTDVLRTLMATRVYGSEIGRALQFIGAMEREGGYTASDVLGEGGRPTPDVIVAPTPSQITRAKDQAGQVAKQAKDILDAGEVKGLSDLVSEEAMTQALGGEAGIQRVMDALKKQGKDVDLGMVVNYLSGMVDSLASEAKDDRTMATKLMAMHVELWRANILTGLFTHQVNVTSNAANMLLEFGILNPVKEMLPGGIGLGGYKESLAAMGGARAVLADIWALMKYNAFDESPSRRLSLLIGQKDKSRVALMRGSEGSKWQDSHRKEIPGKFGKVVRGAGFVPLGIEDAAFKVIPYRYELARQERAGEARNVPKAIDYANKMTFQEGTGMLGMAVSHLHKKAPYSEFWVTFVKTMTNLIRRAFDLTPGISQARNWKKLAGREGNEAQREAVALSIVGMGIAGIVLQLAGGDEDEDKLSGFAPMDHRKKLVWLEEHDQIGWRSGDKVYPFYRFSPLAEPAGLVIGMRDSVQQGDASPFVNSLMQAILSKHFMAKIADLYDGIQEVARAEGNEKSETADKVMRRQLSGIATGTVMPNFIAQFGDMSDPYKRETKTILEDLQKKLPGLREELPIKLRISGEKMEEPRYLSPYPIQAKRVKKDVVARWLLKLNKGLDPKPKSLEGASQELRSQLLKERWELLADAYAALKDEPIEIQRDEIRNELSRWSSYAKDVVIDERLEKEPGFVPE